MPRELVEAHRDYDMGGILYHPWRKRVAGTWHVTDRTQSRYWDPEARELVERIGRTMPDGDTVTFGSSDDGARHLVVSSGVRKPPRVWLFDRANDRLNPLATRYPLLKSEQLVPTVPIAFTSRDGLALRGYLTLPAGRPVTGLPLVLFPHGSPAARDALEFDPWTQFLASRGWAVLQMNFRGSAGYGSAFMEAGFKRWGLEMQDDLADGVRAVVDRGVQRTGRHDARYVELPLGDHSLSRQEDLLRSFLEMERFPTRYLDDQ